MEKYIMISKYSLEKQFGEKTHRNKMPFKNNGSP